MTIKRILVVEDNGMTAMVIQKILKQMEFTDVLLASNYTRAIELYKSQKPHIVLLDIDLEAEKDGIDIAREVRKHDDIPIIYLTADHDPQTIQRAALTLPGSYLSKPFSKEQLKAALTLVWSIYCNQTDTCNTLYPLSLYHSYDQATGNLYEDGVPIHLTSKEKQLVNIFCHTKKTFLDTQSLSQLVWMGDEPASENALRNLIYRLHKKLTYNLFEYVAPEGYHIIQYPMLLSDEETPA